MTSQQIKKRIAKTVAWIIGIMICYLCGWLLLHELIESVMVRVCLIVYIIMVWSVIVLLMPDQKPHIKEANKDNNKPKFDIWRWLFQ